MCDRCRRRQRGFTAEPAHVKGHSAGRGDGTWRSGVGGNKEGSSAHTDPHNEDCRAPIQPVGIFGVMRIVTLAMLLTGCSSIGAFSAPHSQPHQIELYNHEVRYDLLSHVSAKVCAQDEEYKAIKGTKSSDPRAVGAGYLFERAKYEALDKIPTADGLLAIRAKVDVFANGQCITVIGRAYRIKHIAAVSPAHQADDSADTSSDQPDEPEKRTAPNDQL
jgi:hypothetical protein